jgi:hypothetical protein
MHRPIKSCQILQDESDTYLTNLTLLMVGVPFTHNIQKILYCHAGSLRFWQMPITKVKDYKLSYMHFQWLNVCALHHACVIGNIENGSRHIKTSLFQRKNIKLFDEVFNHKFISGLYMIWYNQWLVIPSISIVFGIISSDGKNWN